MSGLGNFLAGAVGGGGAAVASLASRYIDEELAQNRAQALAEIQHQTMVRGEEYMQSAPVQARRVSNERNLLRARYDEALSADVARATNQPLRQAKIDDRVSFLRGTTPAEVEAQNKITEGTAGAKLDAERMRAKVMTPLEIERAAGIAEAQWRARSEYDDLLDKSASGGGKGVKMSEAGKLQLQDLNKQDEALQKAINDGVAGGTLKQDPNDPAWQHFTRQKQALQVQKMRVFAREGLISGAEDAASVIASGATPQELEASMKQAQLIGSEYAADFAAAVKESAAPKSKAEAISRAVEKNGDKDFVVELNGTRQAYGNAKVPGAQPSGEASSASGGNLLDQARQWFSATGRDYDNQEGKAELRRRINEAQNGGNPLTRVERMRATQLGLMKA